MGVGINCLSSSWLFEDATRSIVAVPAFPMSPADADKSPTQNAEPSGHTYHSLSIEEALFPGYIYIGVHQALRCSDKGMMIAAAPNNVEEWKGTRPVYGPSELSARSLK